MKHGAKRQIVTCPQCHKLKVTLGEGRFRCCGKNYTIKDCLANENMASALAAPDEGLEVQA